MPVNIEKAPRYVRELAEDTELVVAIATSFEHYQRVFHAANRSVLKIAQAGQESAVVVATANILNHIELLRDIGKEIIAERDKTPEN